MAEVYFWIMMKGSRILVVDDEQDIREVLEYNLKQEGYIIETADNGKSAQEQALVFRPHLILMDLMMPEMDGIEACREIRLQEGGWDIVIVLLSAQGEDYSQIAGYEAGSDDFIVKPFSVRVLIRKVGALLNRQKVGKEVQAGQSNLQKGLFINRDYYTVFKNQDEIELPRKEFEILSYIASKPNRLFSREEIFNHIWGTDTIVGDRTLDVHIRNIRSKIGDKYIRTVKGVGYKFTQQ